MLRSYETLGSLEEVVRDEIAEVRRCTLSASGEHNSSYAVNLLDGSTVPGPLLEWGSSSCWPRGSNSFISKDFLARGVYYPQLVRMFQFIPMVWLLWF